MIIDLSNLLVVGGIVRNREWIISEHLDAMWHACKDHHTEPFYVTGDNHDFTEDKLVCAGCRVKTIHTGFPGYERGSYHSSNMGFLRNEWAKAALENWPNLTHLWIIDSDVIVSPTSLTDALELDKPFLNLNVPVNKKGLPVYMFGRGEDGNPKRTGEEKTYDGPPCRITAGGCSYLIRRDFVEAMLPDIWGTHGQGEDGYLSVRAHALGLEMWADPHNKAIHVMEKPHG